MLNAVGINISSVVVVGSKQELKKNKLVELGYKPFLSELVKIIFANQTALFSKCESLKNLRLKKGYRASYTFGELGALTDLKENHPLFWQQLRSRVGESSQLVREVEALQAAFVSETQNEAAPSQTKEAHTYREHLETVLQTLRLMPNGVGRGFCVDGSKMNKEYLRKFPLLPLIDWNEITGRLHQFPAAWTGAGSLVEVSIDSECERKVTPSQAYHELLEQVIHLFVSAEMLRDMTETSTVVQDTFEKIANPVISTESLPSYVVESLTSSGEDIEPDEDEEDGTESDVPAAREPESEVASDSLELPTGPLALAA